MKMISKRSHLFPSVMGGITFLSIVAANAEERGFYFGADLGIATVSDLQLKNLSFGYRYTAKTDAGPRLSLAGGYDFYEWFGAGMELSVIGSGSSDYWQVPLLANFEFRLPNKSRFIPLIGGGPGAAYRNFSGDNNVDGHLQDVTFAWQVYGGLRYKVSERSSVGLLYKYLDLPSSGEDNFTWGGDAGYPTRVKGTHTQSVSISFEMRF